MWRQIWIRLRLILLLLLLLGLCVGLGGCLKTFSLGTAAKPARSYVAPPPRDDRADDLPTPQLFNFGFDLRRQEEELNDP